MPGDISYHHGQRTLARRRIPVISIDGYQYMCSKINPNVTYVVCKYKKIKNCKFRGQIVNNRLVISNDHNHARISNAQVIYHFEESLFNEVKKEHFKSLRVIYDEMSLLHYEAAVHVPWVNIKSKMLRWRRQTRPVKFSINKNNIH
ncbi:uncharacterized protein LOC123259230 [Cotesia glomerata]|uniref:uncharacterized protein LOC123259230 n=1 Tax=Cotesia glomerata TaxID=32391 RepID=UPI001D01288B|nr:uncharacterized protein LOC123259230 [Cotesia glomerata]